MKKSFLRSDAFGSYVVAGLVLAAGGMGVYELFFKKKWQLVPAGTTVNLPAGSGFAIGQANATPAAVAFADTMAASGGFASVIVSAPGAAVPPGFPANDGLGNAAVRLLAVSKTTGPVTGSANSLTWVKLA